MKIGSFCAILDLLGKIAKLRKLSDAKSWIYSSATRDQDCQTSEIAKPGKPGDAKPGI